MGDDRTDLQLSDQRQLLRLRRRARIVRRPECCGQAAVRGDILSSFKSVSGLTFTERTESASVHGDLRYGDTNDTGVAHAYYPSSLAEGGDVWLAKTGAIGLELDSPQRGNYAFHAFLHETGHALGLKHGHEAESGFLALPSAHDSMEYSVMTYRSYVGGPLTGYTNGNWDFAQTLMQNDVAAIQAMYGANFTTNATNTSYYWNKTTGQMSINGVAQSAPGGNVILMNVWDGGGIDLYDFSDRTANMSVDLTPGGWINLGTQLASLGAGHTAIGNISNSLLYNNDTRSLIEHVVSGAGHDSITGNVAANNIYGGAGNDAIYGGAGHDLLVGDAGNDSIYGGGDNDVISELAGSGDDLINGDDGIDIIYSGTGNDVVSGGTDAANNYANLGDGADTFAGAAATDVVVGGIGDDAISGNAGDDSLYGEVGNDTVNGGDGIDVVSGGAGNDNLNGGAGNDLLVGDAGADLLFGGSGIDIFYGGADNDTLNGGSDFNNDGLYGGAGFDTFQLNGADYHGDYIYDFQGGAGASDVLVFSSQSFASIAEVRAAATYSGSYTSITAANGSTSILVGVNLASILDEDILLSGLF